MGSDDFKSLHVTSTLLKSDGEGDEAPSCFTVADIEARSYVWIDEFEGSRAKEHPSQYTSPFIKDTSLFRSISELTPSVSPHVAPGKLAITAAMTPPKDQEEEFDRWYKQEHYGMLAKMKGYLRTRRYRISKTEGTTGREAPKFLAVHEFEDGELDGQRLGESVGTEWSKKVMGGLVESQIEVWKMRGAWGDLEVRY